MELNDAELEKNKFLWLFFHTPVGFRAFSFVQNDNLGNTFNYILIPVTSMVQAFHTANSTLLCTFLYQVDFVVAAYSN